MKKYKIENGIKYELEENEMYYPILEIEPLKVGKYGRLAMEHMKNTQSSKYDMLGILGELPKIFNGLDERVHNMIDKIMDKKLKEEPIQDNWNVLEIEKKKKMLYREAEEMVLNELVYINHFQNVNMTEILKEN